MPNRWPNSYTAQSFATGQRELLHQQDASSWAEAWTTRPASRWSTRRLRMRCLGQRQENRRTHALNSFQRLLHGWRIRPKVIVITQLNCVRGQHRQLRPVQTQTRRDPKAFIVEDYQVVGSGNRSSSKGQHRLQVFLNRLLGVKASG